MIEPFPTLTKKQWMYLFQTYQFAKHQTEKEGKNDKLNMIQSQKRNDH